MELMFHGLSYSKNVSLLVHFRVPTLRVHNRGSRLSFHYLQQEVI